MAWVGDDRLCLWGLCLRAWCVPRLLLGGLKGMPHAVVTLVGLVCGGCGWVNTEAGMPTHTPSMLVAARTPAVGQPGGAKLQR